MEMEVHQPLIHQQSSLGDERTESRSAKSSTVLTLRIALVMPAIFCLVIVEADRALRALGASTIVTSAVPPAQQCIVMPISDQ